MRRFDDALSGVALPVGILVAVFAVIGMTVGDAGLLSGGGLSSGLGGDAGTWHRVMLR